VPASFTETVLAEAVTQEVVSGTRGCTYASTKATMAAATPPLAPARKSSTRPGTAALWRANARVTWSLASSAQYSKPALVRPIARLAHFFRQRTRSASSFSRSTPACESHETVASKSKRSLALYAPGAKLSESPVVPSRYCPFPGTSCALVAHFVPPSSE